MTRINIFDRTLKIIAFALLNVGLGPVTGLKTNPEKEPAVAQPTSLSDTKPKTLKFSKLMLPGRI